MTKTEQILLLTPAVLALVLSAAPQDHGVTNPVAGNPHAIQEGASLFRANCSPCHGLNAQGGGRGPDLTAGRWVHGSTDADLFRTVTRGVPGTEMPANALDDSEVWAILAYVRSLAPAKTVAVSGDTAKGKKIFWETAGCSTCHMVQGRGGVLGPDLSQCRRGTLRGLFDRLHSSAQRKNSPLGCSIPTITMACPWCTTR